MREGRRPSFPRRALWHRVRHGLRKGAVTRLVTCRTDVALSTMRRHVDPDRRPIEPLALCITRRFDAHQRRLTMHAPLHCMRLETVRSVRRAQGVPRMAGLAAMGLLTGLP